MKLNLTAPKLGTQVLEYKLNLPTKTWHRQVLERKFNLKLNLPTKTWYRQVLEEKFNLKREGGEGGEGREGGREGREGGEGGREGREVREGGLPTKTWHRQVLERKFTFKMNVPTKTWYRQVLEEKFNLNSTTTWFIQVLELLWGWSSTLSSPQVETFKHLQALNRVSIQSMVFSHVQWPNKEFIQDD